MGEWLNSVLGYMNNRGGLAAHSSVMQDQTNQMVRLANCVTTLQSSATSAT